MVTPSPSSSPSAPVKPRSALERALVWGGILVLLALVGIEFIARNAQSTAAADLIGKFEDSIKAGKDVKLADVKTSVGYKVPRVEDLSDRRLGNGAKRLEVYEWFSINPLKKRALYVYYGAGDDPDVVGVSTEEETETIETRYPSLTEEQKQELLRKAEAAAKKPAVPDTAAGAADENKSAEEGKANSESGKPAGSGDD